MPHETQHCPDDEPFRITLAKAILAASHTLDNVTLDDGVIISTYANMLALKRLHCMGHRLWPAASITTPPVSNRVSLHQPSATSSPLSLSLSLWSLRSQTRTFYITCPKVRRNLARPSQNSESLCMERRAQVGHFLLCCTPLTSVTPSWVPRSRWDAAEAPTM